VLVVVVMMLVIMRQPGIRMVALGLLLLQSDPGSQGNVLRSTDDPKGISSVQEAPRLIAVDHGAFRIQNRNAVAGDHPRESLGYKNHRVRAELVGENTRSLLVCVALRSPVPPGGASVKNASVSHGAHRIVRDGLTLIRILNNH
jgi:hypothetical protein